MGLNRDISIFAKPARFQRTRTLPRKHLIRASSIIRGNQMAEYLGCKLNPTEGYENDVCIHVKPVLTDDVVPKSWIDVMDGYGRGLMDWFNRKKDLKAIAFSDITYRLLRQYIDNQMVVIPQHHCNFDREKRTKDKVDTVGFIGGEIGFGIPEKEIRELIEGSGFKFVFVTSYQTREEVVDFYKQIDIQITWASSRYGMQAKAPLKVVNAASYGIPTAGYPQECYQEVNGCYAEAETIDNLLGELKKLKSNGYYEELSWRALEMSEKYHISKVAELYRGLC